MKQNLRRQIIAGPPSATSSEPKHAGQKTDTYKPPTTGTTYKNSHATSDDIALGVVVIGGMMLGGPIGWGIACMALAGCLSFENVGDPIVTADQGSTTGADAGVDGTNGEGESESESEGGFVDMGIVTRSDAGVDGAVDLGLATYTDAAVDLGLVPVADAGVDGSTGDEGNRILQVSSGLYHTCAILVDHTVKCWGSNTHGRLGDDTTMERHSPAPVVELGEAIDIEAGYWHACARSSPTPVVW